MTRCLRKAKFVSSGVAEVRFLRSAPSLCILPCPSYNVHGRAGHSLFRCELRCNEHHMKAYYKLVVVWQKRPPDLQARSGLPNGCVAMLVFTDWDETISSHDTLAAISPEDCVDAEGNVVTFTALGKAYTADMEAHTRLRASPTTLEAQLEFLDSLDAVELKSQARIEAVGLFKGFDPIAMEERARKEVSFRNGWPQAASWLSAQSNLETHFISVGWSGRFIWAALDTDAGGHFRPDSICANEIELDSAGRGTGKLTKSNDAGASQGIRVASDKLREMQRIDPHARAVRVYAGDSTTDLVCLLSVHVGLILGEAGTLLATIERIGFADKVLTPKQWHENGKPLGDPSLHSGKKVLVHVRDWEQALPILQELKQKT